jgi:ABC-type Fe3+/spermidine/putrescine transport system ATPase subunit
MQVFLKQIQRRIATTFVFVTHDQDEAITMSDRIVVMNLGRIEQVGTPRDLYFHPQTRFVAGFFGDNNLIEGTVASAPGGTVAVDTSLGRFAVPGDARAGQKVLVAVRPESLRLVSGEATDADVALPASVDEVIFVGATLHVVVRSTAVPAKLLRIKIPSSKTAEGYTPGQAVRVAWAADDAAVVPL